jgi:hypothetical protein
MPPGFTLDSGGAFVVFLMVPNTLTCNSVEIASSDRAAGLQLREPSETVQAMPFLARFREVPSSNLGRNTDVYRGFPQSIEVNFGDRSVK